MKYLLIYLLSCFLHIKGYSQLLIKGYSQSCDEQVNSTYDKFEKTTTKIAKKSLTLKSRNSIDNTDSELYIFSISQLPTNSGSVIEISLTAKYNQRTLQYIGSHPSIFFLFEDGKSLKADDNVFNEMTNGNHDGLIKIRLSSFQYPELLKKFKIEQVSAVRINTGMVRDLVDIDLTETDKSYFYKIINCLE